MYGLLLVKINNITDGKDIVAIKYKWTFVAIQEVKGIIDNSAIPVTQGATHLHHRRKGHHGHHTHQEHQEHDKDHEEQALWAIHGFKNTVGTGTLHRVEPGRSS
jgi:hypothetical protein